MSTETTEEVPKLDTSDVADSATPGANVPPVTNVTPGDEATDQPETFPREYVEKLRDENAKYRQRAAQSDELATRLHLELVKATGRLADPTDLPFEEDHLRDPAQMVGAIDALLTAKPHLASRIPAGDIGQGANAPADAFSLAGLLRGNAS